MKKSSLQIENFGFALCDLQHPAVVITIIKDP